MKSHQELVDKYNTSVPRYTSYPPVPFWKDKMSEAVWLEHILSHYDHDAGIDLYVHVPYCESLCFYCGCNRTITKDHSLEEIYLNAVKSEWALYLAKLGPNIKVNSLHFGGGTPTFLSPSNLDNLITFLTQFKSNEFMGSIEIDPRTCHDEHLVVLKKQGFQRVSLGIQDFDPNVQKAINRFQTPEQIEELVSKIRALNFESVNFDLIYGLPRQTIDSIKYSMTVVNSLKPDLIAFYSYAHLPQKIKNQRLILEHELPTAEQKQQLFATGAEILFQNGYFDIGMDHFSLPSSYLYQAKTQNKLKRSFMGYTDKKSPQLIGLGPTAISDSAASFVQNIKDPSAYVEKLQKNELPIEIGHILTEQDQTVKNIIQSIMCHYKLALNQIQSLPSCEKIAEELKDLESDGIITFSKDELKITESGAPFIRNVAMVFDHHLQNKKEKINFSKSI